MALSQNELQEEVGFWRRTIELVGENTKVAEQQRIEQALVSAEHRLKVLRAQEYSGFIAGSEADVGC